jgi:hypothetical protein
MEENKKQYLSLLSEIIAKEAIILGDMAILEAKSIANLVIDSNGNVVDIKGYTADAAQQLVNRYMNLSGQASKNVIDSIFAKYPQIKRID